MALVDEQLRALFSGKSANEHGIRLHDLRPDGLGLRAWFDRDDSEQVELLLQPPGTMRRVAVRLNGFDVAVVGDPQPKEGDEQSHPGHRLTQDVLMILETSDLGPSLQDWAQTVGEAADDRFIMGDVAEIKVTSRCNQRCVFCKSPKNTANHIPPDEVAEVLPRLAHKTRFLTLGGGETLLSERLEEHVRAARRAGFEEVEIQTNGMQLAEPGRVRRLKEAGVTNLLISLHAHNAALSDRLTGTPGGFRQTMEGIERCLEADIPVCLCHVICEGNFRVLPTYAQFVTERFAGYPLTLLFTLAIPTYRVRSDPGLMPRLSNAAPLLRRALTFFHSAAELETGLLGQGDGPEALSGFRKILDRLGRRLGRRSVLSTPADRNRRHPHRWHIARVIRHCGLPLCVLGDLAHYHDDILFDAHPPARKEMEHPPLCEGCAYESRCAGLWRTYVERFGHDSIAPVSHPLPARVQALMATRTMTDGNRRLQD